MSKWVSIVTLVIGGIIVADILIHPHGTATAAAGIGRVETPAFNALLGR